MARIAQTVFGVETILTRHVARVGARRRTFLLTASALWVTSLVARAQTGKTARLGVLLFSTPDADPSFHAFRQGLRELGYVEGKNLTLLYRYAEGKPDRLATLAAELVALDPEVIVALGGDVAPFARNATRKIPVVMAASVDPVRSGLVKSLAQPGGNVTGVTFISSELAAKRLQILKEAAPKIARVAVLWNPDHVDPEYAETQAAGVTLGMQVQSLEVRGPADFDAAFAAATAGGAEAIVVVSSRLMSFNRQRITEFAAQRRLPLVCGWGPWVEGGALLSYGPDIDASVRRAAWYVDRILKGAEPAKLPVEQPTRFELVVNLRAAKAFGLAIPQSVLQRADRVIE
ncbi:MAG: ABC transporter substrate-binding protein [Burkholderiaceae bacterium]